MISGLFSAKRTICPPEHFSRIVSGDGELIWHPVSSGFFSGGFYLHDRLPVTRDDFIWTDEVSGVTVLLSGFIYNRSELTGFLKPDGQVSDPELIGRLFLGEGPVFAARLNGDFAVAIINPQLKEVWLYRDHIGIRPMAYAVSNEALFFSTDITSLCFSLCEGSGIDTTYLTGHFRYIDFRTTPCGAVKKLPPGHYLHFKGGSPRLFKYWQPEKIRQERSLTHEQMLTELDALLRDAVRIRCDARFTAGAHVSSGLDSGVVALLARSEYVSQKKFSGFSWSPENYSAEEVDYDERDSVRRLCSMHNILPVFSQLSPDYFIKAVSRFHLNHGFFWEEATLSQAADAGVNLLFSGWGGDEFVSTAAPSIEADLLRTLKLCLFSRRNELRKPVKFLKNVVRYILMPALRIHERGTTRAFRDEARYLRPQWQKSDRKAVRQFYFHTSRRGHHLGMLRFYHLQGRCEKWFPLGYRQGVEYRYPLLDKRLIEFMLRVPSELLCATDYSRPLLREISEGLLPEEVRLNTSKRDPVYRAYMDGLYREAAVTLLDEVGKWRDNPDLHFIDFERLTGDIYRFRSGDPAVRDEALFRGLIYVKAMDRFTRVFRNSGMN